MFFLLIYSSVSETDVNLMLLSCYSYVTILFKSIFNIYFNLKSDPRLFFLLLYCEYELLHLFLLISIVFSRLGVAIVKALLKSRFDGLIFLLILELTLIHYLSCPLSFVNYIKAFKYYKGLNFLHVEVFLLLISFVKLIFIWLLMWL